VRTLIGHEYEVRVEDDCRGLVDGWFRARYLTPHARQMGWLWEIEDSRFSRMKLEEVSIVEVRPISNDQIEAHRE